MGNSFSGKRGICNKVLGVKGHPALSGKGGHAIRMRLFSFRNSLCNYALALRFIRHVESRGGFQGHKRLVRRLRTSTRTMHHLLTRGGENL